MSKRSLYFIIGLVLVVVSVFLLYDIFIALPETVSQPQVGSMPDTTGDWYLAKLFGSLLLGCVGMGLVIVKIIEIIGDRRK